MEHVSEKETKFLSYIRDKQLIDNVLQFYDPFFIVRRNEVGLIFSYLWIHYLQISDHSRCSDIVGANES